MNAHIFWSNFVISFLSEFYIFNYLKLYICSIIFMEAALIHSDADNDLE